MLHNGELAIPTKKEEEESVEVCEQYNKAASDIKKANDKNLIDLDEGLGAYQVQHKTDNSTSVEENKELYNKISEICQQFYSLKEPSLARQIEAAAALLIRTKLSYAGNGGNFCFTGKLDLKLITKQIMATNRQACKCTINRLDFRRMLRKVPKNAILFIDPPYLDALLSACGTYDNCFTKENFLELLNKLSELKNPMIFTHSDIDAVNTMIEGAGFNEAHRYGNNSGNEGFNYKTIVWTKNIEHPEALFEAYFAKKKDSEERKKKGEDK